MSTLGEYLAELRQGRGLTFRDLEEKARISNGYLNLLEHDRIKSPSPEILFKLANFYGVPLSLLMKLAGYPTESDERNASDPNRELASALLEDLTREELERVRDFVGYLRVERRQRK
ncbi:MAG: helix-turn-helix domain-containing protein [Acidobacteriia bacterium]|nr:helix-turn-helix domain-containing protein [Terriglobia bacterium]